MLTYESSHSAGDPTPNWVGPYRNVPDYPWSPDVQPWTSPPVQPWQPYVQPLPRPFDTIPVTPQPQPIQPYPVQTTIGLPVQPGVTQEQIDRLLAAMSWFMGLGEHGAAFLRAIMQTPNDRNLWLVLYDWLLENGHQDVADQLRTRVEQS